jgi:cytoplasmic iron level regulating protein YaaA (DUF328/UPF0246 family)
MHQNLLIVACSQRKRCDADLLAAIERYDGGNYRLLRKAKRDGYLPENLDILILSAKYGLITSSSPIAFYEQRMDKARALELQSQTTSLLGEYAKQHSYQQVYVDLGADYYPAIGDIKEIFQGASVIYAQGRIGERLANLKKWLQTIN